MAHKIAQAILQGLAYVRLHPQFLFTLILILLIPVAFLYSGQQFLQVATNNIERLEGDRVGILQDMLAQLLYLHHTDTALMQTQLQRAAELNPDFSKIRILIEENGELTVVAALDTSQIGTQPADPGIYRTALQNEESSYRIEFPETYTSERIWQVFRSVRTADNQLYYIFTEVQFGNIDTLLANRIQSAYLILILVLAAVLFLAYRHVRLIDYGYLYRETKRAIETRDMFTNMVTHELRAPLTAIRGYASMINEDSNASEKTRAQALRIQQSSERLLLIVNDLLEVARLQSGKLQIEKGTASIHTIIKNVLTGLESSAAEKGISLSHEFADVQPELNTDAKRLHQVLTNLVSNAIKYTEQGTITVALEDKRDSLKIRVQDTGMGIEADDQKKLFAPFFRVESDDVSKITGTGLGMWITKQLVALLGGHINVESIRGVGTHVVVSLPKS